MTESRVLGRSKADGTIKPVVTSKPILTSTKADWSDIIKVEFSSVPARMRHDIAPLEHTVGVHLSRAAILTWRLDGQQWQCSRIAPGQIHVASADVPGSWGLRDHAQILLLALVPDFVSRVVKDSLYPDQIELVNKHGVEDGLIKETSLALKAELETDEPCRLYGETLATGLAFHMLKRYGVRRPQLRTYEGGLSTKELRRVQGYIDAHLDQVLSLETLADLVGMSVHHFARMFRKSVGLPPYAYVKQQRIERARRLLEKTSLPIIEICHRVGYASQSHFTKQFRLIVGTTPYDYRRQSQS